jgi:hypothetical protein
MRLFMHVISYVLKVSTIEEVVLVLITTPSVQKKYNSRFSRSQTI